MNAAPGTADRSAGSSSGLARRWRANVVPASFLGALRKRVAVTAPRLLVAAGLMSPTVGAVPVQQVAAGGRLTGSGVVEGIVRLRSADLPAPTRVQNTTDPEVCGPEQTLDDLLVSPESGGVQHVVVTLTDVPRERVLHRGPKQFVIDNRGCQFDPHVAVVMPGDTIIARNSDATLHTVHFYGALRGNLSLPQRGMQVRRVAQRPGVISVLCDVHGWMKAYVVVHDHPFHDVTDRAGRFRIEDVPPGEYTVEAWHEVLGTQEVRIRVESGRVTQVELEYRYLARDQR